jgi:hypothetical protein
VLEWHYKLVIIMQIRLAVGRIGDHVGPSGGQLFAVDLVTAENLLDEKSRNTLVGKPIDVNHDEKSYGRVLSVDSELINGVLHCTAEITDPDLIDYLANAKKSKINLETSPSFTTSIAMDSSGRRIQGPREYNFLSILTAGVPGRGGSDVRVHYKYYGVTMDELIQKIDALAGAVDAMAEMMRAHYEAKPEMPEEMMADEDEKYAAGVEEGKAIASTEYSLKGLLKSKGLEVKAGNSVEELLSANLPSLGIATEGKSLAYMAAAFDMLPLLASNNVVSEKVVEPKASNKSAKLTVSFGKGK